MFRSLLIVICSVAFAGCASTLPQETSTGIKQGKVVSAAVMLDKKIQYNEMVYKVLYNETRTQEAVFGGFWDVDKDHTKLLTSALQALHVNVDSVSQALPESEYNDLYERLENSYTDNPQEDPATPFELNETTRSRLLDEGYQYLVLFRTSFIMVDATSITSSATLKLPSTITIIDLVSNGEDYNGSFLPVFYADYDESVRELEDDNLALIKSATQQRLEEGLRHEFSNMLSIEDTGDS
ncbi:hypothetical protein EB809_17115 [Marinobacter sp. R17]|uniref:hypothetical protein n=1 Tax=Marinobacter sp. R17 TaxID=2484250 RepID=UPI000F4CCB5C|nr:hypothetical protein [Marinobacter sp. R17]ROT96145.1 hypothetical protein EB809_17115 [Marinobacter sp. R17]